MTNQNKHAMYVIFMMLVVLFLVGCAVVVVTIEMRNPVIEEYSVEKKAGKQKNAPLREEKKLTP